MAQAVLLNSTTPAQQENVNKLSTFKFQVFACLWAIATLFHMANHRIYDSQLHLLILTLAAVFVLMKPSSMFRFVVFISLQLFEVVKSMPAVSNHWIFTAFVNTSILSVLLFYIVKRKSFKTDKGFLYESFAPIVRIEVIILYFFVVFHKLNSAFFFPEVSCATDLYVSQNTYSLLPESPFFLAASAWFTVIIEALIPILFCFRRTRLLGVFIGAVFHTIIAFNPFNGFYDFSSMIFAVYFLFCDNYFSQRLYVIYGRILDFKFRLKEGINEQFSFFKLLLVSSIFILGMGILYGLTKGIEDYFLIIFWGIYSLAYISVVAFVLLSSEKRPKEKSSYFTLVHPAFLILPILVFVNGICPYLGLKTENSFAMFSNLRTEGGESNHFLIPAGFQLFSFQDELIEITSSSDPNLQKFADEGKLLVSYEFKHLVSLFKPEKVEYIRNGKPESFQLKAAMASNDNLLHDNPFIFRKLFFFRAISKGNPQPCSH